MDRLGNGEPGAPEQRPWTQGPWHDDSWHGATADQARSQGSSEACWIHGRTCPEFLRASHRLAREKTGSPERSPRLGEEMP